MLFKMFDAFSGKNIADKIIEENNRHKGSVHKAGRNDPCPCGSGKKYKKCCLGKERRTDSGESAVLQGRQEDESFDKHEMLLNMMNNFRRFTLDRKPHIKQYYKIKRLHGEILGSMIKHYDDGKFELKFTHDHLPQKKSNSNDTPVVYLTESSFDLDTDIGVEGYYDLLTYKSAPNANCITEEFIRSNRYRKPEKIEFLNSMLNSTLGLFEVTGTDLDEGFAFLRDVFTGAEYTVTDIGLSGNQNADFYLYTRIVTYQGISFCAGLNFVFSKSDAFIKKHISHHTNDYNPDAEFLRFTQMYNQYSKFPDKIKIVTNKMK
jgi:hypothetical protein